MRVLTGHSVSFWQVDSWPFLLLGITFCFTKEKQTIHQKEIANHTPKGDCHIDTNVRLCSDSGLRKN